MKARISVRLCFVVCLMVLIGFEVVSLWHARNRSNPIISLSSGGGGIDIAQKRRELDLLMKRSGDNQAYELFKNAYQNDTGNQHTVSHIFGELLYDRLGISGMKICDSTFAYGCYHGFFRRAVSKEGLSILPKLDLACTQKKQDEIGGCQHGLGHGIVSYLGYSKLLDALSECRHVSFQGPIGGCTSGVFMEYNLHTMDDPSGKTYRIFKSDRPYEPCDEILPQYAQACYFQLPQWWGKVYARDYKQI